MRATSKHFAENLLGAASRLVALGAVMSMGFTTQSAIAQQPTITFSFPGNVTITREFRAPRAPKKSQPMLIERVEVFKARDSADWQEYIGPFIAQTSKSWFKEAAMPASMKKGRVMVEFSLRADGSLLANPKIKKSSGDRVIDAATITAIVHDAPYAPLPLSQRAHTTKFRVTFLYNHPPAHGPLPVPPKMRTRLPER